MWIKISALSGFLAVALGAVGSHIVKQKGNPKAFDAFMIGANFHLIHSMVLLSLALYARSTERSITLQAALFSAGILVFSGSLYGYGFSGLDLFRSPAPYGGFLLFGAWLSLIWLK